LLAQDATTLEFAEAARQCAPLVAVLAGHIHDATAFPLVGGGRAIQYTVDAGCYGGSRLIDFVPLLPGKL